MNQSTVTALVKLRHSKGSQRCSEALRLVPFYQNIVLLLKQETHDEDLNEPMVDESSMQSEFISDSFATEQGK